MFTFSQISSIISVFFVIKIVDSNVTSVLNYLISIYGEGYGTEWIYFPDEEGINHFISLNGDHASPYFGNTRSLYSELEFRLYSRHTNNTEQSIILNQSAEPTICTSDIDLSNYPLKLITHGWRSNAEHETVVDIKNAYLRSQDVNVITIDWSYTANSIFYNWVANQTVIIGSEIALFLNALCDRYNVSSDQIHLIGHSLGAHIMGIAAYHSKNKPDRITGLDPARPLFEYPSRNYSDKLDSSDAVYVDIIHTCAGILGIEGPSGTADFYPNSGIPPQPGCDTIPKILEACSHGRSYHYFAESIITPKAFPAYQCSNWQEYMENRCVQYGYMGDS